MNARILAQTWIRIGGGGRASNYHSRRSSDTTPFLLTMASGQLGTLSVPINYEQETSKVYLIVQGHCECVEKLSEFLQKFSGSSGVVDGGVGKQQQAFSSNSAQSLQESEGNTDSSVFQATPELANSNLKYMKALVRHHHPP